MLEFEKREADLFVGRLCGRETALIGLPARVPLIQPTVGRQDHEIVSEAFRAWGQVDVRLLATITLGTKVTRESNRFLVASNPEANIANETVRVECRPFHDRLLLPMLDPGRDHSRRAGKQVGRQGALLPGRLLVIGEGRPSPACRRVPLLCATFGQGSQKPGLA